ncbi:MAG: hypothetical protein K6E50_00740 [Lachnospiraceae bacterium]|nr:hypothetical protein [Lachnospiraceae bacterium]
MLTRWNDWFKIRTACGINGEIWVYDIFSRGIYILNYDKTISVTPVFRVPRNENNSEIRGIFFDGNKVVFVPEYLNDYWFFMDRSNCEVTPKRITDLAIRISEVVRFRDKIYLLPIKQNEPIIVLSENGYEIEKEIEGWSEKAAEGKFMYTWGVCCNGDRFCYPMVMTGSILVCSEVFFGTIQTNIREGIYSIALEGDKIWILPKEGKSIFYYLMEKKEAGCVRVFGDNESKTCSRYSRIMITEDYIILLPLYPNDIIVLNKNTSEQKRIPTGIIRHSFFDADGGSIVWWYHKNISRTKILLLPFQGYFTILDIEEGVLSNIEISDEDTGYKRKKWLEQSIKENGMLFEEKDDASFKEFLQYCLKY